MEKQKSSKKATYTKEQVLDIVAEALADTIVRLEDPSLVIAEILAINILNKKLK